MNPLDFINHLVNLLLPALGTGALAAGLTKLLWRRGLADVPYLRLAGHAMAASSAVSVAGLVIFGRDGQVHTYVLMVACCAAALGWAGRTGRAEP